MKKRIINILTILLLIIVGAKDVNASSVHITPSPTTVTKGNVVKITVTINANDGIYTTTGSASCSGAGVTGGIDLSFDDMNTTSKSKSFTFNIKPTATGTITCSTSNVRLRELSKDGEYGLDNASISIRVNEPVKVPPKQLSSDNNLNSLSIDGQELTPAFNKDVLEYKLTVDEAVEKINIKADANDSKASISGIGEVRLANGENTFEIKVTAENGNEKIYKLIVTVEDQHPITIKKDKDNLTIVKKNNDLIEKLDDYEEKAIKIDNQEVISYYNKKTKVTLVLLKNRDNKIKYYVYNEKENTYTEYKYIKVGNITLQLIDSTEKLDNFKKYELKLQGQKIDYYKIKKSHKVGLIYGTNIKTGNTSYYVYDQNEETLSKYYDDEIALYKKETQKYKNYLMMFMGVAAFFAIIVIIISIIKTNNKKKRIKRI